MPLEVAAMRAAALASQQQQRLALQQGALLAGNTFAAAAAPIALGVMPPSTDMFASNRLPVQPMAMAFMPPQVRNTFVAAPAALPMSPLANAPMAVLADMPLLGVDHSNFIGMLPALSHVNRESLRDTHTGKVEVSEAKKITPTLSGRAAEKFLSASDKMSQLRMVGYLNEIAQGLINYVGEPFKKKMDNVVYGFSGLYALAKGIQAHEGADKNESKRLKNTRALSAFAYGAAFQWIASCEGPVLGVKMVQKATKLAAQALNKSPKQIQMLQTIMGLAAIPLMVKPIDMMARFLLDHTLKPATNALTDVMAKMEHREQKAEALKFASANPALKSVAFESFA